MSIKEEILLHIKKEYPESTKENICITKKTEEELIYLSNELQLDIGRTIDFVITYIIMKPNYEKFLKDISI